MFAPLQIFVRGRRFGEVELAVDRDPDSALQCQLQGGADLVRRRDPGAEDPQAADEDAEHVDLDLLAGVGTAEREPAVAPQAGEVLAEERAGGGVEDGVDARAAGQLGDRLRRTDLAVDEDLVGAELADPLGLSAEPTLAITLAPAMRAHWTRAPATPPEAEGTSTVSRGRISASPVTILQAVLTATRDEAAIGAWSSESSGMSRRAGIRTSSAYPPQLSLPM